MRKLHVSTLMTLDGVIQDPGGSGEITQGGWGNPDFTEQAERDAYEHLMASDYFLYGRVSYELMSKAWGHIKAGRYLERMNSTAHLM
jgi:hypothetical protein